MAFTKISFCFFQRAVILQGEIIWKNTCLLFLLEESIHEVSRHYLDAPYIHSNMLPTYSKLGASLYQKCDGKGTLTTEFTTIALCTLCSRAKNEA